MQLLKSRKDAHGAELNDIPGIYLMCSLRMHNKNGVVTVPARRGIGNE